MRYSRIRMRYVECTLRYLWVWRNSCVWLQGANFITGAIIFNGVTCGLIYRPLRATVGRAGSSGSAAKDRRVKRPRSVIFRKIMEEKRRRRTTSTGSLDGTMITKDNCLVRPPPDAPDSLVDNLQVIPEHEPVCVNAASMEQNDVGC